MGACHIALGTACLGAYLGVGAFNSTRQNSYLGAYPGYLVLPTVDTVAKYITKFHQNSQPIAKINAVHKGPSANKGSSDDASGLEPVIHLAHGARVMLISNCDWL